MIYVMSDIHGYGERFEKMLKLINLQPDDHLYILGDVVDRGPDGIKILRKIMNMPNVSMILGNHEHMMLEALYYPIETDSEIKRELKLEHYQRIWYNNGGDVTHYYLKHTRKNIRKEIFEYLNKLPLNIDVEVNEQKYVLVHGAPLATFSFTHSYYRDPVTHAVWTRLHSCDPLPEDKITIFGHTPTCKYQKGSPFTIYHAEDRIGIDCGCGYGQIGRLACLRLDDMKEFYVS